MKKSIGKAAVYFFTLCCFATSGVKAQTWEWATKDGGTGNDETNGVSTDPSGNVYTTGNFSGSATFGSFPLTSSGSTDIFVAKQNKNGTYLWAVKAGGTGVEEGVSIVVDDAGNSFVTGNFTGTATFGTTVLTSASQDCFLARYDVNGTLLWVVQMGGISTDQVDKISISGSGNHAAVCVTGYFNSSATFGSTVLTSAGGQDIFVASYAGTGGFIWAKRFGGANADEGTAIVQDAAANIYLSGSFQGSVTFGAFPLISNSFSQDVFTAKLDVSGNVTWVKQGSGSNADYAQSIAIDKTGNVYVGGKFGSFTMTFGAFVLSTFSGDAVFVVKYNNSGTEQWAKTVVYETSGTCSATGLAIDNAGNYVYITGEFNLTGTFQSTTLSTFAGIDSYLSRYNSSGTESLVLQAGGTGDDHSYGIAINALDFVYIAGAFNSATASFGTHNISTAGSLDGFTASYDVHQWPLRGGGNQRDYAADVAVDNAGNTYITGVFNSFGTANVLHGSATFGSTTLFSTSEDGNAYIAKYTPSGILSWVHQGGCTSSTFCGDDWGQSIAVDASGNSYIGGEHQGSATFDGIVLPGGGGCVGAEYIAKYNTNGTIQWAIDAVQHGASSSARIQSVTCDGLSNVYVTGFYNGTVTIGSNIFTSGGAGDIFIFKLNSAGVFQWSVTAGGTGDDQANGITTDGTNIYITGKIVGTAAFGTFFASGTPGNYDAFIAKYSVAGVALGATAATSTAGQSVANDITSDKTGGVYITGEYSGSTNFAGNILTSSGNADVFVCKYTSTLTSSWAKSGGGSTAYDIGYAITWGSFGLFVTGNTLNSGNFGSFPYTGIGSSQDVFITKYNQSTGAEMMFDQMGGTSNEIGYGIAVDGSGYVYVGGTFKGTGTFGSAALTSAGGSEDMFLEKIYGMDGTGARVLNPALTSETSNTTQGLLIYPNPNNGSFAIETNSTEAKDILVFDVMGKIVSSMKQISDSNVSIDITDQPAGIYIVEVVCGNSIETQRIIKQ